MTRAIKTIIVFILIILMSLIWSVVFDIVWPSKADAQMQVCEQTCDGTDWSRAFKAGDLHNSKNRVLGDRVERKITRWYNNRDLTMPQGDDRWWDDSLKASQCVMWGGRKSTCLYTNFEDTRRFMRIVRRETTRVTIKCGGAAILGAIGGRLDSGKVGWWGAGFGAGSCMFQTLGTKADWW